MPGTEHFRNVERHTVETDEKSVVLRVDESLHFANARYLEETVLALTSQQAKMKNLVLACQEVNTIDASALESLESINGRLKAMDIRLHMCEVKGAVMAGCVDCDRSAWYHSRVDSEESLGPFQVLAALEKPTNVPIFMSYSYA